MVFPLKHLLEWAVISLVKMGLQMPMAVLVWPSENGFNNLPANFETIPLR